MVRTMYVVICGCVLALPFNPCGWVLGFPLQLWSWQPAPLPDQEVKRALRRDVPAGPPDFRKDRDPCCIWLAQPKQNSIVHDWNTKGACTCQHMQEQILPNALKPSKALIYKTSWLHSSQDLVPQEFATRILTLFFHQMAGSNDDHVPNRRARPGTNLGHDPQLPGPDHDLGQDPDLGHIYILR